jgi:hypothetical protein
VIIEGAEADGLRLGSWPATHRFAFLLQSPFHTMQMREVEAEIGGQKRTGVVRQMDDPQQREFDHRWKLFTARFEYAWRFFDFHAKQRITMFNFFILFSGILINAFALLLQKNELLALFVVSLFGATITVFFIFLERRNEELVHIAEDTLRELEQAFLFKDIQVKVEWPHQRSWWLGKMDSFSEPKEVPLGIFVRQDYDKENGKGSKYSHGTWIPSVQMAVCALCLLTALCAVLLGVGVLHHTAGQQSTSPPAKVTVTVEQHP